MASPPSILSILVTFILCISKTFVSGQFANFEKLQLPGGVTGPGGITFGGLPIPNEGPFVTTNDGGIMKWVDPTIGFVDFAYTSPTRTKELCDGVTDPDTASTCGQPFALSYHPVTHNLYIADAYHGLLVVGPDGGLATQLAGGFKFVNDVDIDLLTGHLYFIDASLTYTISDAIKPGFIPDSSGRLLRYDPLTQEVSVLLSGLSGGGGVVVSSDGTFVLVSEIGSDRITKYWLVGPKANTAEVLLHVNGNPNKIKQAETLGEFWVATTRIGYAPPTPGIVPEGVRFNSDGDVLQTLQFGTEYPDEPISLVQEHEGKLYVGSRFTNFVGVYSN
ncbi:unnamed protein product [Lactuca virosa]|uniref:Strictosidine synthase conserved region domain-containing protein n=1 Tax=Lactuca virosa TaxID=75947 RepID=A0AAU9MA12_9ASTR|nr:unnamed protein product [Lactuca virosa]